MRRVAFVGLNARAERLLLPGLRAAGNCTLAALCSRDGQKAADMAARFAVSHAFDSVEALADSGVADTLFINTPAHAHAAPAIAAARAGMAIICEKPLADSAAVAREIAAAVATAGVPSAVHFTFHGLAGPRMVARLVERGAIGRLRHAQVSMLQPKDLAPSATRVSSLVELGSHCLDLVRWWSRASGVPAAPRVICAASAPPAPGSPDSATQAVLRLGEEALVSVLTSRVAAGFENAVRALLCGDAGAIDLDMGARHVTVRVANPTGAFETVPVDADLEVAYTDFPAVQMRALVASLDGSVQFPTISDALVVQELQDGIAEAAGLDPRQLALAGRSA